MTKILFIGATYTNNRGSAAMLISAKRALKESIPDAHFALLTPFPESDQMLCKDEDLEIIGDKGGYALLTRLLKALAFRAAHFEIKSDRVLNSLKCADIIIDLSGDGFTDNGGYSNSLLSCYDIIISKIIQKPFVIYAQSIGPFKSLPTKMLSRYCLNHVDVLTVREEITKKYLEEIGVKNVHLTADSAFLLEPCSPEEVRDICCKENVDIGVRPIFGVSVSQHIFELEVRQSGPGAPSDTRYIRTMVNMVDYLKERYNAQIIFIPHVTNESREIDDRYVANAIYNCCKCKDRIILVNTHYSPQEMKGLIGLCDIFIGARMHANIAATSMNVPTLSLSYSHKSLGIMKMLEMENYVIDYRAMDLKEITNKIDEIWEKRKLLQTMLLEKNKMVKKQSGKNTEFVKKLLERIN
jgi:colanic acid/amylovoran biosynthesis protein